MVRTVPFIKGTVRTLFLTIQRIEFSPSPAVSQRTHFRAASTYTVAGLCVSRREAGGNIFLEECKCEYILRLRNPCRYGSVLYAEKLFTCSAAVVYAKALSSHGDNRPHWSNRCHRGNWCDRCDWSDRLYRAYRSDRRQWRNRPHRRCRPHRCQWCGRPHRKYGPYGGSRPHRSDRCHRC